jgi:hypothetical protein
VRNKILFIVVAMALVLGVSLVGCTGGPVTPVPTRVYVGLARELNQDLKVFECGYGGTVYRYFTNVTNTAGGIHLSSYNVTVPIELKVRDFNLYTWDLAAVTLTLINTDHVDVIWGGPGTDCIFTQAPICNANAIDLITLEGGASSMIWNNQIQNWPYVWVTLSFSNWNQIPVLHDMLVAATNNSHPTAYITYIGDAGATHGIEYRNETIAVFGANYTIDAGFHPYTLTAPQATAIITAAETAYNSTPYDIFCAYTYPWNVATLQNALIASTFNPPAILFGPGGNANYNPFYFGPYVNGMLSFIVADNHTSTAITNMYAGIAAQAQKDWDDATCVPVVHPVFNVTMTNPWETLDYWGQPCYVAGLELWKDAVEAAGNLSSVAVRNQLAVLNTTTVLGAHTWFTVFGGGLGGGILAYECHPGEIGQWINQEYRIVGGNAPTANFTLMTGSWQWLLD